MTRQSGKKKTVLARYVHNDGLLDALNRQAFAALRTSPGARAYYDRLRARGVGHHAALRHLGNCLVGILHGCLKTRSTYGETTAWAHHQQGCPVWQVLLRLKEMNAEVAIAGGSLSHQSLPAKIWGPPDRHTETSTSPC